MKTNRQVAEILLISVIVVFSASAAYSIERYVPGEYATIQSAVDASDPGDTIMVSPGLYNETVTLNKDNLTLIGVKNFPAIDPGAGNGLIIQSNGVTINDLKISGLIIGGNSAAPVNSVTVDNCIINGLDIDGATNPVSNVTITSSFIFGRGNLLTAARVASAQTVSFKYSAFLYRNYTGATTDSLLDISNTQGLTIENGFIETTSSDAGAGIKAISLNTVTGASIKDNIIEADSVNNSGVGLYLAAMAGTNAIQNNIIYGSTYSIDGDSTNVTISYNDLPEGSAHVGAGVTLGPNNLSAEPVYEAGGYSPALTSPCVAAGIVNGGSATDIGLLIPPVSFTSDVISGTEPLTVSFTDTSRGFVVSRLWEFGDYEWYTGGCSGYPVYYTSTERNPVHTYNSQGVYTVKLTVRYLDGRQETATDIITVDPAAAAAPAGGTALLSGGGALMAAASASPEATVAADVMPPEVAITSPLDKTGVDTNVLTVEGTVYDQDISRVEISVNGTYEGDAIITGDNFSLDYIVIPSDGTLAVIEATAIDGSGNRSTDSVSVIKGYMRFIEPRRSYTTDAGSPVPANLTSIAAAQDILDHMRCDTSGALIAVMPTSDAIYGHAYPLNLDNTLIELDAQGMKAALGKFDIYDGDISATGDFGDPAHGYDFQIATAEDTAAGFTAYLNEMVLRLDRPALGDGIEVIETPYTPVAVPMYGYTGGYEHWIVINGFTADIAPSDNSSTVITIYGLFLTDPDPLGIGENVYVPVSDLGGYLEPVSSLDIYDGKYIMITDTHKTF